MTFMDTQTAALDKFSGIDPYADFRVESPREIGSLMRELNETGTPIQLSSPSGANLATVIWSVDSHAGRLAMRAEPDHPQLQALIQSDEVAAVAYLDAVKLQFDLHQLVLVRAKTACAMQTVMPRQVYRFQRRQAFRVRAPDRLSPSVRLRHPALPEMQLSLRVLDLSIGGCALLLPDDVPELRAGSTIHGARFELDPSTQFTAALQLHHISSMRGEAHGLSLGCEFKQLDPDAERALQRYIDQTQKRKRLLSLG